MTAKQIILDQFVSCHNEKNWFVPLKDALAGLTSEDAAWHKNSENHSIWQIVNHLIFWNERWLKRFKGGTTEKMDGENSGTFSENSGDKDGWKKSAEKLDEVFAEWETEIQKKDEAFLQSDIFLDPGDSWYAVFAVTTIHNAYHIGQIVTIRKQQGSWNSDNGVK
jgi:uncharacterized damage-inducible protein DinB